MDLNPRKIGGMIHGLPVLAPTDLLPAGEAFVLAAGGKEGGCEGIRQDLEARGYVEDRGFLGVA